MLLTDMAQFRGGECYVTAKKIMNTHKHQHPSSHTHIHTSTPKRSLPHNIYCLILSTSFSLLLDFEYVILLLDFEYVILLLDFEYVILSLLLDFEYVILCLA